MPTVASRELRNHTADVLRQVAEGSTVTITVNGEPVAQITRPAATLRAHLPRAEVVRLVEQQRPDPRLRDDLAWISGETTEDLGPPR